MPLKVLKPKMTAATFIRITIYDKKSLRTESYL